MLRQLFSAILLFTTLAATAIPAHRGLTTITLPDGTTREVRLRGDEHCHWMETPDGRRVAPPIVHHDLIERTRLMQQQSPFLQHLPRTAPRLAPKQNFLIDGSFPTTGKRKLLAVLINYANTTPTYPREQFEAMLNEPGYGGIGSFRDYYLDQSFGQLDIETTVTPWITVSQPRQYYNADNTPSLIAEALRQLDTTIDFHDYDNDGDGILDGLIVIHAGRGQEASGDATDIWSHSSTIYGMQFDGVSIYRYTIEPECLYDGPSTIGVFCHEFGHNLGALDYYDTNYSSDGAYGGTGPWDLMGEGAWNGPSGRGDYPASFTSWQKWQFGWITPITLDKATHISDIPATTLSGKDNVFRMNTTIEGDYFILENRQRNANGIPWDRYIPGHGLVVTHVVESLLRQRMSMNNVNATYPQAIYTVCADAHCNPAEGQPSSYGDLTSSATPFPGTRGHNTFSDETLPSTASQDGRRGYCGLYNIIEEDHPELADEFIGYCASVVSFDFTPGDAPQRPLDFAATVRQGIVTLSWRMPTEKDLPSAFTLYRCGKTIATLSPTQCATADGNTFAYTDTATDANLAGKVDYQIDATYASGLTSAYSSTSIRVPRQYAATLAAEMHPAEGTLDVTWQTPSELTRCTNDLHYDIVDHSASTFCYAHRFRADDLRLFVGRQVRSITFIPQQRSTTASYKICVWSATPATDGTLPTTVPYSAATLVASRSVTEFSPTYQRTVPFLERPTIEAGRDYWIGVEITSNNNLAEVVTDQHELLDGFGNWMSINGGSWQPDPASIGNYILSATLSGDAPEESIVLIGGDAFHQGDLFADYTDFDADYDLHFPIGYRLYYNNIPIAESVGNHVALPLKSVDQCHTTASLNTSDTLQLVSVFKGNNESLPLSIDISYELNGIIPISSNLHPSPDTYDLSGRRTPLPTSSHGVFLHAGRKIIR